MPVVVTSNEMVFGVLLSPMRQPLLNNPTALQEVIMSVALVSKRSTTDNTCTVNKTDKCHASTSQVPTVTTTGVEKI